MWKELMALDGTFETVEDINREASRVTGDAEPIFDPDTEEWRAWVEWKDGKTIILCDAE